MRRRWLANVTERGTEALGTRTLTALRLGVGLFFGLAGLAKLFALDETARIVAERGIPWAWAVGLCVGAGETVAGAALLTNRATTAVARVLMFVFVPVALLFHNPFGLPPGASHINAIALTMDGFVLLGLALVARGKAPRRLPLSARR